MPSPPSFFLLPLSLILLLLFCNNISYTNGYTYLIDGQSSGTCQFLTETSYCYPLIGNNQSVYIPYNVTINDIEVNITKLLSMPLDNDCLIPAQILMCSLYYNPCNNISIDYNSTTTYNVLLPSLPCFSICDAAYQGCSEYIQFLPPDMRCDMNTSSGQSQYPQQQSQFNVTIQDDMGTNIYNITEITQCNDKYSGEIEGSCPYPLIYAPNRTKDLYYPISDNCVLPCPFQLWRDSEEKAINVITIVLSVIGFICSIFLILFNGILPNKISSTNESILYVAIGAVLIAISQFQNQSKSNFSCADDARYVTQSDVECGINGFIFQLGAIVSLFGWTYASYDFYRTIHMQAIQKTLYIRIAFLTVVTLLCFLPFAGHRYGSTLATNGCWIVGDKNNPWPYLFFYVEAIPCIFAILLTTGLTFKKLYQVYIQIQSQSMLFYDVKLMIVMILFIFNSTFVLSFKFYMDGEADNIKSSVADWVECISKNGEPNCELEIPYYSLRILQVITTNSWGILAFIAFALDASLIALLKRSDRATRVLKYFGFEFLDDPTKRKSLTGGTRLSRMRSINLSNTTSTASSSSSGGSSNTMSTLTVQSNVPSS